MPGGISTQKKRNAFAERFSDIKSKQDSRAYNNEIDAVFHSYSHQISENNDPNKEGDDCDTPSDDSTNRDIS